MVLLGRLVQDQPASLRLSSALPFVGRSAELEQLRTLLPPAAGEGLRIMMIGGEPGSGKSRLVREFATEAAADGALVLYGACDAVVQAPYGPFAQALEQLPDAIDPGELTAALGNGAADLSRLVPGLPSEPAMARAAVLADPDTERLRLHTAVTEALAVIGRPRPVLLVVEDAHWADGSSLLLLRHLARAAGRARALVLVTFRDTEAGMPDALSEALADFRRSDDVARIRLTGLTEDEVNDFVDGATEGELGADLPDLAGTISELTGGNAFLVCELWRALVETDVIEVADGELRIARPLSELGTPESVREVVSQRLARLGAKTTVLLELAATVGNEFELDVVRCGAGLTEPELVAALDEAVRSGIVDELAGRRLAYRFTHELVRRAVYDRLTAVRRAELHLRVGEARESAEGRSPRALADLAYHFTAAAPLGEVERAIEYNRLAASAATEALAFDEAARLLQTTLELGIQGQTERAQVLLELGYATHRAGKASSALDAFTAAAGIARELGDAELLARAAIGYEDTCWRPGALRDATDLLEEASAALGDQRSELRVGLLSGLARALDMRGEHQGAAAVRSTAIDLARKLNDRGGLANVLMRSYWSRGATTLEQIIEMLSEAKALGEEMDNIEVQTEASSWRVPSFVAAGELTSARSEVSDLLQMAKASAQPFMIHVAEHYRSAIALADGHLEQADDAAQRSYEAARLLTGGGTTGTYGLQLFSLRREQGRLAELAPVVRVLAGSGREHGAWGPGMVALLAELGMEEEARSQLERIMHDGLEQFRESLWLAALAYITDACSALGDRATAELVYPQLEPLSGTGVMIGHLVSFYGAADRYLGMLAATLGELDRAEQHFELAIELNRRMGARTWLAHSQYQYARALIGRGRDAEERAGALAAEARELATRIRLRGLAGRIDALGARGAQSELPDGLSPREAEILRLVARGLSNREIGSALFISEHTAANHIRSILRKTGCANRTEAASYAHRHSLVEA
jgi:DNA-binding CsgD family transcriptional regulator/tetratricopeptide (TPR) repeat protein